MDEQNDGSGAWLASRLGNFLDALTYQQINKGNQGPVLYDSRPGYGIDQYGNAYVLGQPSAQAQISASGNGSFMTLLLIGGVILLLAGK
jgi:hypothetical protein